MLLFRAVLGRTSLQVPFSVDSYCDYAMSLRCLRAAHSQALRSEILSWRGSDHWGLAHLFSKSYDGEMTPDAVLKKRGIPPRWLSMIALGSDASCSMGTVRTASFMHAPHRPHRPRDGAG